VKLTVVGCSGSFPGPESPASCYLVEADGFRLLLDLGSGALGALQRHIGVADVDAVALTHLHPDHCLDMCSYYVARRYHPGGPLPRIPVYGPSSTPARLARAYDVPAAPGMTGQFVFSRYPDGVFEVGPFRVSAVPVSHPVETYGLRVEHGGRVLAYSGDSAPCDGLVRVAKGADTFLCEASFHEGRDTVPDLHMNGRQAAEHATRAGAGRLLITHIPPWNDPRRTLAEASQAYDGPTDLARPDATYDI
jgi:ribonuclease BN (tRNA processing enzyme)